MAARFRVKLVEMDDLQREIIVRSRDSSCLQDLRRTLERSRENLNAVSVCSFQNKNIGIRNHFRR